MKFRDLEMGQTFRWLGMPELWCKTGPGGYVASEDKDRGLAHYTQAQASSDLSSQSCPGRSGDPAGGEVQMKSYKSPCVAVLGNLADVTAENYPRGMAVRIVTDRQGPYVQVQIVNVPAQNKMSVAYLNSLEAIDEMIGDLLAARADMVKLIHRKA